MPKVHSPSKTVRLTSRCLERPRLFTMSGHVRPDRGRGDIHHAKTTLGDRAISIHDPRLRRNGSVPLMVQDKADEARVTRCFVQPTGERSPLLSIHVVIISRVAPWCDLSSNGSTSPGSLIWLLSPGPGSFAPVPPYGARCV